MTQAERKTKCSEITDLRRGTELSEVCQTRGTGQKGNEGTGVEDDEWCTSDVGR